MNIPPSGRQSPEPHLDAAQGTPAQPASTDAVSPPINPSSRSTSAPQRSLAGEAQQRLVLHSPMLITRSRRLAMDRGLAAASSEAAAAGAATTVESGASAVTAASAMPAAATQTAAISQSSGRGTAVNIPVLHPSGHRRATQLAVPVDLPADAIGFGHGGFAALLQSHGVASSVPTRLNISIAPLSPPSSPDSPGQIPFGALRSSRRGGLANANRRTARVFRDLMQPSPMLLADIATQMSGLRDAAENAALHVRWNNFSSEDGAQVFSEFLVKLTGTVNADNAAFKKQTADLLTQLGSDPVLRQHVFAISVDATTACEDRVSLAFVTMLAAARAAKFRQTTFASDADAIAIQRQFHRLDLLHDLAHTIATETQNSNEELETHLHLLTKHVDALQLAGTVPAMDMRWDTCSHVSPERDATVAPTIKRQENEQFARWLSHSPSWLDYIEREDRPRFDAMHEARETIFEQQFQSRLDARLSATGLSQRADPDAWMDAERALGKVVLSEMNDRIHADLTADFLRNRGTAHLLEAYWPHPDAT